MREGSNGSLGAAVGGIWRIAIKIIFTIRNFFQKLAIMNKTPGTLGVPYSGVRL